MTQQQYTPVSWQDETTSQQGTLINAERLNQMQTAHHYADGLEETDTVPTADPGVDYHKVVYCTADNTIYRWDGTQWTADIDDPTRELLEEHEADHNNPHEVTKAQVGLGNADNTADLDKPISTATQTALDGKVSIIPVTTGVKFYAQTSGGTYLYQGTQDATAGITSVPLRDSSGRIRTATPSGDTDAVPKKYADDALATKADKATTYTKTEIDTALATKADKATTLAGYGITDAYTKSEADTLLGAKADQATTYTKSEVNTALALKADKANTYTETETDTAIQSALDGYLPMVRTTGNQDIAGTKTFLSTVYSDYAFLAKRPATTRVDSNTARWKKAYRLTSYSSSGRSITFAVTSSRIGTLLVTLTVQAASAAVEVHATGRTSLASKVLITKTSSETIVWIDAYGSTTRERMMVQCIDGFNIASFETITDDVAYIHDPNAKTMTDGNGNVISYTDLTAVETEMVDTVSAQTIDGAKTFTGQMLATGQRAYSAGNTTDVATIETLDAYTPMVRTTGAQIIAGIKTHTDEISISKTGRLMTMKCTGVTIGNNQSTGAIVFEDSTSAVIGSIYFNTMTDGTTQLIGRVRNGNGTFKDITIGAGEA